jgi:N-acyl-L-homoserine lactone synthetase
MRVHVVTRANRALYKTALVQMHQLRHRMFVEEMGWKALYSPDGLEIDDFDDDDAVYLLLIRSGLVTGCMRLLPTWRRCMATEVFPQYLTCDPRGPDVWEWTRYVPGLLSTPRDTIRQRAVLLTATLEFAASRGVRQYFAMGETKFMPQLEELGWTPRPLGLPQKFDEGVAMVMGWDTTPDLLPATRRLFGIEAPTIVEAPAFVDASAFDLDRLRDLIPEVSPRFGRRARTEPFADLAALAVGGRA